ncbi:hypothetical protein [Moorena sp. SIO2C4]|nr:hypothetical protein [Moorena sp. SIO2C4]NES42868.1 hypothetical protein [Moorena sp. SIO2C4]
MRYRWCYLRCRQPSAVSRQPWPLATLREWLADTRHADTRHAECLPNYLLPITYYLLPITYYLLPITYYLLPITHVPFINRETNPSKP